MSDESSEAKTAVQSASARVHEAVPIIGIGASAGGIDALQKFFAAVPPDSGQAFIVVQHLAPDHKSILADLLARSSRLPVRTIESETKIEPNNVYVIPPNAILTIKDGRLRLTRPAAPLQYRTPIDSFFVSLAEDQADNAACVILSGTGSDGTLGLRAIKEHGGVSLAQTSDSAEYDGMMRSAISTGLVDFILPAEEMPAKLIEYFRQRETSEGGNARIEQDAVNHLHQLFALLGTRTGHNFSGYKDKSVIRRVQRRMQLSQMEDVPAYIERLRKEPHELDLLFQDMLIGVTNFFRDGSAFTALSDEVILKLFEGKGAADTVRVWVAGCSTGEEAYSIAILLRERMPKAKDAPNLQIFATDINPHALEVARLGRYPISIAQDVSAERLERHFVRENGTFRVSTDLREICLFSLHNVLRDPPFSKLDLVSCRNLMIYLNGDLQSRLVPLFHYALNRNGYLFLGTSENVTRHTRLFAAVDKHNRIFRRLSHADRRPIDFPLTPGEPFRGPHVQPGVRPPADASLMGHAEREILARYAPAFVVINAEGEVLQSSPRTGKYLELPSGAPDTNIFSLARKGLGIELRALVRKSITNGSVAAVNNVSVGTNGGRQTLSLMVQPLRIEAGTDPLYMVVFQDVGGINAEFESSDLAPEIEGATQHLEIELRTVKERLQTTTEELESSNEELKSANEELSSINEELQSSNEELETSKEELQSTNEELHTVNGELSNRVELLSQANSDIKNLLENTQIATIFLDRELNVKSFTPAASDLFRLVESDAGRPILHVRSRFTLDTLETDLEKVLRTLSTVERFVRSTDSDALYLARILPYSTVDNVIGGVVLTFVDITRITAAETRIDELTVDLRNRLGNLETLLDLLPIAILIVEDGEAQQVRTNTHGMRLLGKVDSGKGLKQISEPIRLFRDNQELPLEQQPLQRAARLGDPVESFEGELLRADGGMVDVLLSALPLLSQDRKPRGAIAAMIEISDRKQAERHQKLLINELNHRVKNTLATVQAVASQSLRNAGSMAQARENFETRLMALSKAHDILTRESWEGVNLREVVAMAANSAENDGRLTSEGPEVRITPKAALALSMALHELSTNALKYGALSNDGGRVNIVWAVNGDAEKPRLTMQWVESGGPIVMPPKRRGFGSRLIERGLAQDLDGKVDISFAKTGVVCTIDAPLDDAQVAGGGGG